MTSLAECGRRFGANKKDKVVLGTDVELLHDATSTGHASYFVLADWELRQGNIKRARVNIKSVSVAETLSLPSPRQTMAVADSFTNPVTRPLPALDGQEEMPQQRPTSTTCS